MNTNNDSESSRQDRTYIFIKIEDEIKHVVTEYPPDGRVQLRYTRRQTDTSENNRAQRPDVGNTLSDYEIETSKMISRVHSVSKGIRYFHNAGFAIHEDSLLFPDSTMDCFRKLKGLKKVVVEGDLGEEYVAGLLKYMNKPPVGVTTTGLFVGVIPKSRCKTCSWPKENYIQVADPPSRAEFHHPSNPGRVFDVRYPDRS